MRRCVFSLLFALLVAAPAAAQHPAGSAPADSAQVYAALSKVAPSLVRIHVVSIDHQDGRELKREASGSGTIITPEGHVVTNHHVAGKTKAIRLHAVDRARRFRPSWSAPIRCRTSRCSSSSRPSRASSRSASFGTRRVAEGRRPRPRDGQPARAVAVGDDGDRQQHRDDHAAAVLALQSHDARGRGRRIAGALDRSRRADLRRQLRRPADQSRRGDRRRQRDQHGSGRRDPGRSRQGGRVRDHQGRPRQAQLDRPRRAAAAQVVERSSTGALVGGTIEGSPAAKAGFQPGDIVHSSSASERHRPVRRGDSAVQPGGDAAAARQAGRRGRLAQGASGGRCTSCPRSARASKRRSAELPLVGITASNLTAWSAKELKRESRDGVHVRGVRPGGPAAEGRPALENDDVIVEVDGKRVKNVDALTTRGRAADQGQDRSGARAGRRSTAAGSGC